MMTPDWKDAPEWANYRARDADGSWYWFEFEPYRSSNCWMRQKGRTAICDASINDPWTSTMEKRP
jgi:uncharacterized iron-regulated membrane protein